MNKIDTILNFNLSKSAPISSLLIGEGVTDFEEALSWTEQLPYRRISNLENPSLVAKEKCGTCSSKHAFLKLLAEENGQNTIKLKLIIFELRAEDAKAFTKEFDELGAIALLEAHCLLEFDGRDIDITSSRFDVRSFYKNKEILLTQFLRPEQSGEFKQKLHLQLFKEYCELRDLDFEKMWALRMRFIRSLSEI